LKLFTNETDKPEIINMNICYNSKKVVWDGDTYVEQPEDEEDGIDTVDDLPGDEPTLETEEDGDEDESEDEPESTEVSYEPEPAAIQGGSIENVDLSPGA